MRKLLYAGISLAAAAAFASPVLAQPTAYYHRHPGYRAYDYAPPTVSRDTRTATAVGAGVVGGTVAGLGVSEGWWGASAAAALPTTVAGAAAVGGVAGMGTVAAVDFMLEPCRGFAAVFDLSHGECQDGHYVGYAPPRGRR